MTDHAIITGLRRREEAAFAGMTERYAAYVAAILANFARGCLTAEDLEELAADVFAGVWQNAAGLREGAPLKPYLAQAARNAARSRLRRARPQALALDEDLLVRSDAPDEQAAAREQAEILNAAVGAMGEPERTLFVRYYFFGERLRSIAARLGLNEATARTKLRRTREKLKQILMERGYGCE